MRQFRIWSTALIVSVSGVLAVERPIVSARQSAREVLAGATSVGASAAPVVQDPTVLRSRYVTMSPSVLPDAAMAQAGTVGPNLTINLFDDATFVAVPERVNATPAGTEWVGHLDGVPLSNVTLITEGDTLAGTVVMPGAVYTIRRASGGASSGNRLLHVVSQVDQAASLPELRPVEVVPAASDLLNASRAPQYDTAGTIDVMVVYTPAAATSAGGIPAMNALINLGISETNTSYANSGIAQRLRLVHAEEVFYTETAVGAGGMSQDLTNLRSGSTALSSVPGLRDAYGADLVSMMIGPSTEACGIGYLMSMPSASFAPFAFNVVSSNCVSPNYTFAHELGHNMGARHDWYVDGGSAAVTPFTYAHGYVNTPAQWRTIMAYNDMCAVQGFNCTRLLYWANPSVAGPGGSAMGIAGGTKSPCATGSLADVGCDADDHLALNNTALTVANFRQAIAAGSAPAITTQPVSATVNVGQTASFTAAAGGSPAPTVQWQTSVNGGGTWTNVPGATSPTYALVTTIFDSGNWFRAVFTNSLGSASTTTAVLTVVSTTLPAITQHPSSVSVNVGQLASFSAAATGSPAPTVRWQAGTSSSGPWTDIPGATGTTHALFTTAADSGKWFRAVFMNAAGTAVTNPAVLTVITPTAPAPTTGDFTGSGQADVLWQHPSTGAVLLWVMNGPGYVSSTMINAGGTAWQVVGTADFTGDGNIDILWQHPSTGAVLLWEMNGTNYVSSTMINAGGTYWKVVATGDFTGDGKPDIVWQHPDTGAVLLWAMNGTTYAGSAMMSNGGTLWRIVGAGDFTGDGKTDLIWQYPSTGAVLLWAMNDATYVSSTMLNGGTAWQVAAIGDYTGDHKPDLVWQHPATGAVLLWEMNGATYVSSTMMSTGGTLWKVKGPR